MSPNTAKTDGRHDSDFLLGRWSVENRKLTTPLDPDNGEWVEFAATCETTPLLGGLGNADAYSASHFPGRGAFAALVLRLFDVEANMWRIWWATAGSGMLDVPVVGSFVDGQGVFECDDVIVDRRLKVRYEWLDIADSTARWRQSFSFDEGRSWELNWEMLWSRASADVVA